jgi:N-acetylmuramoyl-L-alanine amidase
MPGVLIEIGFLSNIEEGKIINSEKGQEDVAKAITDAIFTYKNQYFKSTNTTITENRDKKEEIREEKIPAKESVVTNKGIVFKVQLSASSKKLETTASNFKGLREISREKSGNLYKYFYGSENSYEEIQKRQEEAKSKGYNSAFVVAYKDGVKISVSDAIK